MSAADRLIGKAHDYEHLAAATAFTVAAIIMRDVLMFLEHRRRGPH